MSRVVSYTDARAAVWSIPADLPPTKELATRVAKLCGDNEKPSYYVRMAAEHTERGLTIDEVLYLFVQSELRRRAVEVRRRAERMARARKKEKES